MQQFIKIPLKFMELDKTTKFTDVVVYAAIDNQYDAVSKTSRVAYDTISEKWNIPRKDVERSIKRLKENGFISYDQKQSTKNKYVFNEYTLNYRKTEFLMLNPELLEQDLKTRERGVLIYLQLLAFPNPEPIETEIEDIASKIGMDKRTAKKYINFFLEENQIIKGKHFYYFKYLVNHQKRN